MSETVFDFLAAKPVLPSKLLLERANSKYCRSLLIREYKQQAGCNLLFVKGSNTLNQMKNDLGEVSLWGERLLVVAEDVSRTTVDRIHTAPGNFLLAELTGGDLVPDKFYPRKIKDLLRVLKRQLKLRPTLTELTKNDWEFVASFEAVESIIRRSVMMDGSVEKLPSLLEETKVSQSILALLKKNDRKGLFKLLEEKEPRMVESNLLFQLDDLCRVKSLTSSGTPMKTAFERMQIPYGRSLLVSEADRMLTVADTNKIIDALIQHDFEIMISPKRGLSRMFLGLDLIRS